MDAASDPSSEHWLGRYGRGHHAWRRLGDRCWKRPIGIVESSFDLDGRDFEGRADVTGLVTLTVRSNLSDALLKRKLLLAWANVRARHTLLSARTVAGPSHEERFFFVETPLDESEALRQSEETMTFIQDVYPGESVDLEDLLLHCYNGGRVVVPEVHLSRMFIAPMKSAAGGISTLQFIMVSAHEITDGLSNHNWISSFVKNLNMTNGELRASLKDLLLPESTQKHLPDAQEELYLPVPGNLARQRWFWAIARVLRHTAKPLPEAFPNPLRRPEPIQTRAFPPKYSKLLDYSRIPALNTFHCALQLSPAASARLIKLCKEAKVSIGAGLFALVAVSMMLLQEQQEPDVPLADRKPFVASFPLNPRPFFNHTEPADSCMLAFSMGIVFPFLSSSLSLEGRFRLLAKIANRQLKQYQKRTKGGELVSGLVGQTPARVIATNYLMTIERLSQRADQDAIPKVNPQGALEPSPFRRATCGVSSMGKLTGSLSTDFYSLDLPARDSARGGEEDEDAFRANFNRSRIGVRARESEFLVGCVGDPQGMQFGISLDANAIDEERVFGVWKPLMESLLEVQDKARL